MSAGEPGAHGREEQDLRRVHRLCAARERGLRDKEDLGEIHRRLLLCQTCAPAPTPAPPVPAAIDPIAVAQAHVDTANSGDFGKTYACYADDSGALVMIGALLLTSKQQIGNQWLKDDVKATRATIQDVRMNGDVVIATGTVSPDRFKKLKINSVAYSAQYVIENGKIRFFYPTLQFTPDRAAKVQAAQQSQAAPTR